MTTPGMRGGFGNTGPEFVSAPAASLGPDRSRRPYPSDARFWISSATWAQRAINAWRAANPGHGGPIEVDGEAGPITMAALRDITPTEVANYPEDQSVTADVLIGRALAERLALLAPVADPPRSAPRSSSSSSSPVVAAPSAPAPVRRRSAWLLPLGTAGVVALIGTGLYFWWRHKPRTVRGIGATTLKPIPAKGDPRGHVTASALGRVTRNRGRKR